MLACLCLGTLWLGETCVSISEMPVSPLGMALQGSVQCLGGESTWWLQSCSPWRAVTSCGGLGKGDCALEKSYFNFLATCSFMPLFAKGQAAS